MPLIVPGTASDGLAELAIGKVGEQQGLGGQGVINDSDCGGSGGAPSAAVIGDSCEKRRAVVRNPIVFLIVYVYDKISIQHSDMRESDTR